MPFALTSDQDLIRKTVAEFADAELGPQASEHVDRDRAYPREALQKMASLGLFGMLVPPDQGGPGTDTVSFLVALEEVAKRSGTAAAALNVLNALGSYPIATFGSDALRQKWLPGILTGEKFVAWALSEPGAGSDVQALSTRAVKTDDGYRLDGLKSWVTGAPGADAFIVFAKVEGEDGDDMAAFVVPSDAEGLRVAPPERMMSLRGAELAQVFLKGVTVPEEDRLGEPGKGLEVALRSLDVSRLGAAAVSTGLAAAALEDAMEYSGQRVQFRQPIKAFQGIQWMIADMDTQVEAARMLTYKAGDLRDQDADFEAAAARAKLFSAEMAKHVTQQSVKIHGGTGFMRDLPVERYNRDARSMSIFGGTSEVQRSFLASKLLDL